MHTLKLRHTFVALLGAVACATATEEEPPPTPEELPLMGGSAGLGGSAGDLLQQHGDAHSTAAGSPGAVLHGDVVVGDDRRDLDARFSGGQFGGHVEPPR